MLQKIKAWWNSNERVVNGLRLELETLKKEQVELLAELHTRVTLCNERSQHVEYYLGIRQHNFPTGERRWNFQQVAKDLGIHPIKGITRVRRPQTIPRDKA